MHAQLRWSRPHHIASAISFPSGPLRRVAQRPLDFCGHGHSKVSPMGTETVSHLPSCNLSTVGRVPFVFSAPPSLTRPRVGSGQVGGLDHTTPPPLASPTTPPVPPPLRAYFGGGSRTLRDGRLEERIPGR